MKLLPSILGPVCLLGLLAPLQAQSISLVSVGPTGTVGNGDSYGPDLSASGKFSAFHSDADNLVPGDTNGEADVFVRELRSGVTRLVSTSAAGVQGDGESEYPSISGNGRYVAFYSEATNLVPGDTNGFGDVFVRDLKTGAIVRVSVDSSGAQALGESGTHFGPAISADGSCVAFYSPAPNLVKDDTNGLWDAFVHDLATGTTTRVSVDSAGNQSVGTLLVPMSTPALSADGRYVAFVSNATNLVPGDTNRNEDVFVHDRKTGTTTRASVSSSGEQPNGRCQAPALSADGRFVAFDTGARNLVPGDTSVQDVFVHDMLLGTTVIASPSDDGGPTNSASYNASLSADGRFVYFNSYASNLVPGDTNTRADIYVRDLLLGETTRLSLTEGGLEASHSSYDPVVSADGRTLLFWTAAPEFAAADTNGLPDVFLLRNALPLRRR